MEPPKPVNTDESSDLSTIHDRPASSESSESYHDKEDDALLRESSPSTVFLDEYSTSPLMHSRDAGAFEDGDDVWTKSRILEPPRHTSQIKAFVAVFFALCWLFLLVLYFVQPIYPPISAKPAQLDTTYRPRRDFDLVVNMYREKAKGVSSIVNEILSSSPLSANNRVFIYNKDEETREPELRAEFPKAEIVHRPNVGREGETFLYHILSQWDDLARHTLFMQALPDDFEEFIRRIRQSFVLETGMLSLSFVSTVCDCHLCNDPYWHDYSGMMAETYELANNASCGWLLLSYKGQFVASAARIRGAGRDVYQYVHDALVREDSWAHQPDYWEPMDVGGDSMNAPALGFSLERLWFGIMQCSNLQVAARCPTMISATRRKTKADDCQCFDYEPGVSYIGN